MYSTVPVFPVLLCGGQGKRLWPYSTPERPKQLITLPDGASMLQYAAKRALRIADAANLIAVTSADIALQVHAELTQAATGAQVLAEGCARNTAAAAVCAALHALKQAEDAVLCLMPSDHVIRDLDAFAQQVKHAVPFAASGHIVLFGIAPGQPDAHFGYIVRCRPMLAEGPVYAVEQFMEKPEPEVASALMRGGRCFWNSGIFLLSAATLLREMTERAPQLVQACAEALRQADTQNGILQLPAGPLEDSPALPIDTLVMESARRLVVTPARFDWADIGTPERLEALLGEASLPAL